MSKSIEKCQRYKSEKCTQKKEEGNQTARYITSPEIRARKLSPSHGIGDNNFTRKTKITLYHELLQIKHLFYPCSKANSAALIKTDTNVIKRAIMKKNQFTKTAISSQEVGGTTCISIEISLADILLSVASAAMLLSLSLEISIIVLSCLIDNINTKVMLCVDDARRKGQTR